MKNAKAERTEMMTRVKIDPGPCGFKTVVTAQMNDDDQAEVKMASGCKAVMAMMAEVGPELDPYEVCLVKPGKGPLYESAAEVFPVHAGCPVLIGIIKCVEAEAGLALLHNVSIDFEEV